jgi:N-acetylmuramoyl-L-alanine amidase
LAVQQMANMFSFRPVVAGSSFALAMLAFAAANDAFGAAEPVPIPIPKPDLELAAAEADPLGALLERLIGPAPVQSSQQPVVIAVGIDEEADRTRLEVELSDPVAVQLFTLTDPNRVVMDMPEVLWRVLDSAPPRGNGIVASYRYGLFREGNSRFVIDLNKPARFSEPRVLPPKGGRAFRLVLDLLPETAESFDANAGWPEEFRGVPRFGETSLSSASARSGAAAAESSQAPALTADKRIIVLDAGHGGIDPGTHGPSGVQEKDIVLEVAKDLRDTLEATGRYSVHLTRDSDVFIPLRGRVDIARAAKADLFVSLHIDSHELTDIRGASVYTLSDDASDREAARLAEKENMSDVIAGVDLTSEDSPVASILIDLAQRNTMNRSVRFAETVLTSLRDSTYVRPSTPHRSAGFAVLKAPDVPAVLIELGYITNQMDESEMLTEAWRLRVSEAITEAIDSHFGVSDTPGTVQAAIP